MIFDVMDRACETPTLNAPITPYHTGRLFWGCAVPGTFVPGYDRTVPPGHFATGFTRDAVCEMSASASRPPETKLLHPAAVGLFDCDGVAVKAELLAFRREVPELPNDVAPTVLTSSSFHGTPTIYPTREGAEHHQPKLLLVQALKLLVLPAQIN